MTILGVLLSGCGRKQPANDFTFIDAHLTRWDEFAQGANELIPKIRADSPRFHSAVANAFISRDARAPSRLVFYLVVQVGGTVPVSSDLGQACQSLFGADVPVFVDDKGVELYYVGDVFYWWEQHADGYAPFPLYDEWKTREFAQKLIPMYVRQAEENLQRGLEKKPERDE